MDGMVEKIEIAGRLIEKNSPCFIIAEAGVNHNGDLTLAKKLIDVAKEAGADAVKFQTFKADRVASPQAPKALYQRQATDANESQLDMLRRLELSKESHIELIAYSRKKAILFLSTPFEEESVDLLESLGVPAFKLPSGEITNLPFLRHVAKKGLPIILSTGMSFLEEVREAVEAIRQVHEVPLVLLHCVSNYPASIDEINLRAMNTLEDVFKVPVGYSDHTLGIEAALAAVALGACVIEKHLTLDKKLPGPDHRASCEPAEFKLLVEGVRKVESSLGSGVKAPSPSEENTRRIARKSLILATSISRGAVLEKSMIHSVRPGNGISPALLDRVVGRQVKRDMRQGEQIAWEELV